MDFVDYTDNVKSKTEKSMDPEKAKRIFNALKEVSKKLNIVIWAPKAPKVEK